MSQLSAGLLLFRHGLSGIEVFLVHPGGPYWASKDAGAWSIPKGIVEPGEDELSCARREFEEETGCEARGFGPERDLGTFRLPSGKRLRAFAVQGECDPQALRSNLFEMEWPPRSGRVQKFPEVDRAGWFNRQSAVYQITSGQRVMLEKFYAQLQGKLE